jgi:hypothetical protein
MVCLPIQVTCCLCCGTVRVMYVIKIVGKVKYKEMWLGVARVDCK